MSSSSLFPGFCHQFSSSLCWSRVPAEEEAPQVSLALAERSVLGPHRSSQNSCCPRWSVLQPSRHLALALTFASVFLVLSFSERIVTVGGTGLESESRASPPWVSSRLCLGVYRTPPIKIAGDAVLRTVPLWLKALPQVRFVLD